MEYQRLGTDEMKGLAIGVITSALSARDLGNEVEIDQRVSQYAHDFNLMIEGVHPVDMYRLCSLLADTNAALIWSLSTALEVEPMEAMERLAKEIRNADTRER